MLPIGMKSRTTEACETLLAFTGNRKRTGSSHPSEGKEFFVPCHDSRVPLKLGVRKQCGRCLWVVEPRWQ